MNAIVIYKSRRGATKRYAEYIAEKLGCRAVDVSYATAEDVQGADVVIYGGGIYAGAIAGSSFLDKMAEHIVPEHFIVFTTGLNDISNLSLLSMVMMRNVPDRLRRGCFEFHFYGALSYDSLKFMDRVMFRAMLSGIKAKKPEARDLRETALLNIKKERVDLGGRRIIKKKIARALDIDAPRDDLPEPEPDMYDEDDDLYADD